MTAPSQQPAPLSSVLRRLVIAAVHGASLLVFSVVVALWVARRHWQPSVSLGRDRTFVRSFSVGSVPIGVQFRYYWADGEWEWIREVDEPQPGWRFRFALHTGHMRYYPPGTGFHCSVLGFRFFAYRGAESIRAARYAFDGESGQCELLVPHWFLAAIAAILPGLRLARMHRHHRRRRRGMCVNCGYDLRATKNRCPECGMPCKLEAGHADA